MLESIVNGTDGHDEVDVGYSSPCSQLVCQVGTSRRKTTMSLAVEDALEFRTYFHFILQGGWSTERQDLHHDRTSTMAGPPPWQEVDLDAHSITRSVAVEANVSSSSLQCSLQTITYSSLGE